MKIAVLNDTHIGVRNDNPIYLNFQKKFFEEVFFPYIDENKIEVIIHAGDLFDKRKSINFNSMHQWNEFFFDEIEKRNLEFHIAIGNHDTYYKNSNRVNSAEILLRNKKNFYIYEDTKDVKFRGIPICLIPWINSENNEASAEAIKKSNAAMAIGHLELAGFEMHKGSMCEHGMDSKILNKFEIVLSGHFHTKSNKGNIHYLGSQYETCWPDWNDQKGFHVLDTETRDIEFIKNNNYLYYKIYYNDEKLDYDEWNVPKLEDKFIKVLVENRTNKKMFNRFIDKITKLNTHEIQIIEELTIEEINQDDMIDLSKDTSQLIMEYVDNVDIKDNKKEIKTIMASLYNEALTMEY